MYRIGIDLGGTNIAVGVVDDHHRIVAEASLPAGAHRPAEQVVADMCRAVELALDKAGLTPADCASIGVGTPGTCDPERGVVVRAYNLNWFDVPVCAMLTAHFGLPARLSNDANCAALAETVAGAAVGCRNMMLITLGTGVGGGIIVDGRIVSGLGGAGGEPGHSLLVLDGEPCTCGRRGCWESYSSATALIRQTKDAMRHDPYTAMWDLVGNDISRVNGRTSFDAMRAGDETAKKVVNQYIFYLAAGITNVVNALQPDMICIGGGIGHEKENLLVPLRKMVERERYSIHAKVQTQIISAELGNDAGLIGAALLDR